MILIDYRCCGCVNQVKARMPSKSVPLDNVSRPIMNHVKELLVIMHYLKVWGAELRNIFKGFDIITDHKNIEYFIKK